MSRIYEIFGTNAHAMTRALMESAGAACKIPSGASVALKPNLVVAASHETGATTHAGVLSGAIEYLRDHGFRDISIIEGSWVGDDTGRAFRAAGYEAVGKKYGVPLFDLKRDKTRRVDTPLRPMDICCRALDADYLINLPVLKGHCQTAMTCALKNCKGCLPDREKRRFHSEGLMRPIAALAAAHAQGGNAVPGAGALHAVNQGGQDAPACGAQGVPHGDSAAADVYLRHVQPQLADHRQGLGREGLVQLDHADIVQCEPRLLQHLADGGHRADAHDAGIHAHDGVGHDAGHGLDAQLLHLLAAHQQQGGARVAAPA